MPLKSIYPDPPTPPEINVHEVLFRRPDQAGWTDYTIHIDSTTGRKRSSREFLERVYDGATALGASVSQGGLGLRAEDGEMVGILSENCMVSSYHQTYLENLNQGDIYMTLTGIHNPCPFSSRYHDSLCVALVVFDCFRTRSCIALVQSNTFVRAR